MTRRQLLALLALPWVSACATTPAAATKLKEEVAEAAGLATDVLAVLPLLGAPAVDVAAAAIGVKLVQADVDLFITLEPDAVATWRAAGPLLRHVLDVYRRLPNVDPGTVTTLLGKVTAIAAAEPSSLVSAVTLAVSSFQAAHTALKKAHP